jgi:chromosome partition protein MukE
VKESTLHTLEEALADDHFPEVDLMLRRGRHIGRDDGAPYDYLVDTQAILEPFYQRFGCELVQQSDGYFFLLPIGDRLGRRQLSAGEMLVGQTLALLYLDPATLQHGGVVGKEVLLQRLSGLVGSEVLVRTLNPRKRKFDERIAAETVRTQVGEALRRLGDLGFLDLLDDSRLRLRPALMRFAEPVRGLADPNAALERLVSRGEVLLGDAS